MSVARKELSNFTREVVLKNEDKALKPGIALFVEYIGIYYSHFLGWLVSLSGFIYFCISP